MSKEFPLHYEEIVVIFATPDQVFTFVDDHKRFSSHMNEGSMMMMGGSMKTTVDEQNGQKVDSHIMMDGKVLGIPISLDEVVTKREPPSLKTWETVGSPQLLVIGNYRMGIEIAPQEMKSLLKVFIDYELPTGGAWLLGYLFGNMYAKWCVRQMVNGVKRHFART